MSGVPDWLIDAREHITDNMDIAGGAMPSGAPPPGDTWDRGYWGGY